ncbi:MAG: hypothetical protein WAN03_19470 [Candidatus Sulfotelmatobacter sp.]
MRLGKTSSVLGMCSLVLIMLGGAASAQITMDDAKVIAAYPLTVDKMERKYEATVEIARLAGSDPDFARQIDSGASQTTLDGQIKAFNAVPKAVSIVQAHGLSVRDYSLITMAINTAMLPQVPEALRSAKSKPVEDPVQAAASPEHVQFVQTHREEIRKWMTAVSAVRKEGQRSRK